MKPFPACLLLFRRLLTSYGTLVGGVSPDGALSGTVSASSAATTIAAPRSTFLEAWKL